MFVFFGLGAAKFFESGNVLSQSGHVDLTGEGFKTLRLKIRALVTCGEAKKKKKKRQIKAVIWARFFKL